MPGYVSPDPGAIDRTLAHLDTIITEAQAMLRGAQRILDAAEAARAALAPPPPPPAPRT